jgi:tetratricopeptide (TPR) repeat protein
MNDIPPSDNGSLPLDVEEQVDKICDRFEDAWKQGQRPRIEDYLGKIGEAGRTALLHHLIKLDIDYRRRAGEDPTAEDYRRLFPTSDCRVSVHTVLDPTRPEVDATGNPERVGRYLLGEEIGKGGIGSVVKGYDTELGCDVAIKVLLPDHQHHPEARQRFNAEAQIGSQLQHPGVVPVHERGMFPDGRPYFVMKLVQGRTLAELLAERSDPAHDLPRFLKIFEQVCQTLAYAHSRGVIHRDLKPSNIMVGAFGEVQVMDWGFAKVLRKEQASALAAGSGESTAHGEGTVSLSWAGQVMGTPGYMPPEQARGDVDQLDERCDVFALGALLCVLLTGKPPYRGRREEVLEAAREGNQADVLARLDGCGADADLVRLIKECLQPRAEDRPRDAGAVAEQVTAYLVGVQERLRQAEMERAAAQAREEEARARAEEARARAEAEAQALRAERRARRRTLALAASLLLLLSSVGAAGWWYLQEQAAQAVRQEQAKGKLKAALGEFAEFRKRALTLFDNPESWKATLDAAGSAVKRAEDLLQQEPQLAGTDLAQEVEQSRAELEADAKDYRLVTAFERVLFKLSEFKRSYGTTEAYQDVQVALAQWGLPLGAVPEAQATVLLQQRPRGIQNRLAALLYFCLSRVPPAEKKQQWLQAVLAAADGDGWRQQVRQAFVAQDGARLGQLLEQAEAASQHPVILIGVADALSAEDRASKVGLLRRVQQQHPDDFWANFALGAALYQSVFGRAGAGRSALAKELTVMNEALAFKRVAVGLRPGNAPAHTNLGIALRAQGDLKSASACWRKALILDPKYTLAHNNLGTALADQGDLKGAIQCYKKALELDPKYAEAHINLGLALTAQGDVKGGITCFHKALDLDPKYATAHVGLGIALKDRGNLKGAIACFQKALELDPKDVKTYNNLGNALDDQGDVKGAIACYKKALDLEPRDAKTHCNLGVALYHQGDLKEAIACFHKALDLDPQDAKTHNNLGTALGAQGDLKGAIQCYTKALDLDPQDAQAHHNLGLTLYEQGDLKGAIASYKQAVALDPKLVPGHLGLGNALQAQGDLQGASKCFRKSIELDPKDAKAYYNLGNALYAQKDWKGASASYQKALDLDPTLAKAHTDLGNALYKQGEVKGAIACYTKALNLDPKYAHAHSNLGHVLQAQGDLKGAIACFQKAIALDPKLVQAHGALGRALLAQGDFKEARAATQQALKLLPEGHPLRPLANRQLQDCQRLMDLDARLTAILKGDDQPQDSAEQLALADLCRRYKKRYAAAARFYQGAFAGGAAQTTKRAYNAAGAAILAAGGQGQDPNKLEGKEKSRLRQQARAWLRDNLEQYTGQLKDLDAKQRAALQKTLQHWQQDTDLASVRDKDRLAKLPEAERESWRQLWADVAALLKQAEQEK